MDKLELIEKGIFAHYPSCPICNSEKRVPIEIDYVHTKYLAALDAVLPVKVKYPVKQCQVYSCSECKTKYADPWLSTSYASMLYSAGLSQHKSGWLGVYKKFKQQNIWGRKNSTDEGGQDQLPSTYSLALKFIGECNSYAQVNCPFAGDLFRLREIEKPGIHYRKEFNELRRNIGKNNVFPRNLLKIYRKKLKKYIRLVDIEDEANAAKALPVPSKRFLLYEQSSLCWGANCSLKGVSCHTFSSVILNTPIQSFSEIERRDDKIDMCFINNLDHFFKPLETLERILNFSKICIVHTHVEILKMQHHFVFSKNFSGFLKSRGYFVTDVSEALLDVKEQHNYAMFFASKSVDFEELHNV